ncbi:hypothetical protein ACIRH0_44245 [Streptomyces sp. NPDC093675]|uniref:hypothetical protein n=1 Tax=Streptomyces sp. NPDC093675 TaxID=3366049 RepID=UPI003810D610
MNWIGNALLALVAGSVGSVVFVPISQRLGEKAKARHAAERSLHGVLRSYRQQLQYHYERSRTEQHGYPPEFAALDGQETLVEAVLRDLQDLGKRKEKLLRGDLERLVGPTMLAFAEGRVHVPPGARAAAMEENRLELSLRRVILEPERYCEGHLQRLLSEQNNPHEHDVHYKDALLILDRMAARVAP